LNLVGNPIVNQNPSLGRIENNSSGLQDALYEYFSGMGSGGFGGSGGQSSAALSNVQSSRALGAGSQLGQNSFGSAASGDAYRSERVGAQGHSFLGRNA